MDNEPDAPASDDGKDIVLDPSGGVPAVAVGTSAEDAQRRPAAVHDGADPGIPAAGDPDLDPDQ